MPLQRRKSSYIIRAVKDGIYGGLPFWYSPSMMLKKILHGPLTFASSGDILRIE